MANNIIISIKTSQTANTPASLANGELAYSYSSDKLYIGKTANSSVAPVVTYIGGRVIVNKVANLESYLFSGAGQIKTANVLITDTIKYQAGAYANNGVMYVKRSGSVDFVTGSSTGQLLQIAANGVPIFDELNGGIY